MGSCSRLLALTVLCLALLPEARGGRHIPPRDSDIRAAPVSEGVSRKRARLVEEYAAWVEQEEGLDAAAVARSDLPTFSQLVRAIGWSFFENGRAQGEYREMLLGLRDEMPWCSGALQPGWRVVLRWHQLEPTVPHAPLPLTVLRACLTICGVWRWGRVALSLWICYFALLRPGECCALVRSDVLLPSEHEHPQSGILLRISSPKRRVGGARCEYARVDLENICPLFLSMLALLRPGDRIWPGSPQALTRRFRKVLQAMQLDPRQFSLASLRTGGATHHFSVFGEDVMRLAWRGRWRDIRTLPHYIQELVASRIRLAWPSRARVIVDCLHALTDDVLEEWAVEFGSGELGA